MVEFFGREHPRCGGGSRRRGPRLAACGRFQGLLRARSGAAQWWDVAVTPITGVDGSVVQLLAVSRDITERRRDEAVRAAQQHVLGMIATGSALDEVLDCLVRLVEQQSDGMRVLGAGARRRRHPRPALCRAEPARRLRPRHRRRCRSARTHGSCGTAMYRGTPVIVTDILTDPLWDDVPRAGTAGGLARLLVGADLRRRASAPRVVRDVLRRTPFAQRGGAAADRIGRRHRPHRNRTSACAPGPARQRGAQSRHPARHPRLDVPDDGRRHVSRLPRAGPVGAARGAARLSRQERRRGAAAADRPDVEGGVRPRERVGRARAASST